MRRFLAFFLAFLPLAASAQFLLVEPNPFGERPVLVPVPTTVTGVSEPVLTVPASTFQRVGEDPARYEAVLTVPGSFAGKRVIVRFNGTGNNLTLLAGGREIRRHWAHTYSWGADITEAVQPGRPLTLALQGEPSDGGLSGRPAGPTGDVQVFAVPEQHLQRLRLTTTFDAQYRDAELEVWVKVSEPGGGSLRLSAVGADGKRLSISPASIRLPAGMDEFKYKVKVKAPRKWDAEHPNLYDLTFSLADAAGKVTETLTRRYGFRQAERRGDEFFVNGRPVKFRGICSVDDVTLLPPLNINHVRQIATREEVLDQTDALGIYVTDEMSPRGAKWGAEKDPAWRYQWIDLVGDMMERDWNHPSVVVWGLGNESFHGDNVLAAFKYTKADDPQRLTIYSWANRVRPDEEPPYDLYSFHYPPQSQPDFKLNTMGNSIWHSPTLVYDRADVPVIPTLFDESTHSLLSLEEERRDPNVRNFWGESIKDMADRSWHTKGNLGFDQYGMWAYVGKTTIPEIWHFRKACSPVRIERTDYDVPPSGQGLSIPVENRYNHTDLSELTVTWKAAGAQGSLRGPRTEPGQTGTLVVPARDLKAGDTVELAFIDAGGRQVDEYCLTVGAEPFHLPAPAASAPRVEQNIREAVISGADFTLRFSKYAGQITSLVYKGETVLTGGPHLQLMRSGLSIQEFWPQSCRVYVAGSEAVIDLDVIYSPIAAAFQIRIDGAGLMTVHYTVKHTPDPPPAAKSIPWNLTDAGGYSEVGVQFTLPASVDRLQWDRKALWTVYPEDHVGRGRGVAWKDPAVRGTDVWSNAPYDLNWWSLWERETPERVESPSQTTNDFRASKEYIRTAEALLAGRTVGIQVLSEEQDAVRMEVSEPGGPVTMYINNAWNYPTLGVGNYMKPPIVIGDGYSNTVHLRPVDVAK